MSQDPSLPPPVPVPPPPAPGAPLPAAIAASQQESAPSAPASGFWAGLTARGLIFDVVGLAFTGAAIYVGLTHGTAAPEFGAFTALAGAYLGLKSGA